MTADNIALRRNAKHIVGTKLSRPWCLRLRPTFTRDNGAGVETSYNPWFACHDLLTGKQAAPDPRNGYLFNLIGKYAKQRFKLQKTFTVGLKGLINASIYKKNEIEASEPMSGFKNPWKTQDILNALPRDDGDVSMHNILQDFDLSEGFDMPDFNSCPLEAMYDV